MGREVRRVPAGWEHPKNPNGNYIPLFGGSFANEAAEWDQGATKWAEGLRDDYNGGWMPKDDDQNYTYEEWAGSRPVADHYMPDWPEDQRTHLQMYEDTSEGTPISPVMKTPEALAAWLAENNASAFGDMTATYEQWLNVCKGAFAPSMIIENGVAKSGVEESAE